MRKVIKGILGLFGLSMDIRDLWKLGGSSLTTFILYILAQAISYIRELHIIPKVLLVFAIFCFSLALIGHGWKFISSKLRKNKSVSKEKIDMGDTNDSTKKSTGFSKKGIGKGSMNIKMRDTEFVNVDNAIVHEGEGNMNVKMDKTKIIQKKGDSPKKE